MLINVRENLRLVYNEAFGDRTDHPLLIRILAFLVDYGLFLITGTAIYFGFEFTNNHSTLAHLLTSVGIGTTYFTLGNSKFCKGQTVGKKLFRIRVVDGHGKYISLVRSFTRSLPIVLLMNSYEIMHYAVIEQSDLYQLSFLTLTTILIGTIYFPLIKLDRQGLHDILTYSQVIPRDRMVKIEKNINWGLVMLFILIVTMTAIVVLNWRVEN
jgi:uncharacterized RDD family membrane protein YckC